MSTVPTPEVRITVSRRAEVAVVGKGLGELSTVAHQAVAERRTHCSQGLTCGLRVMCLQPDSQSEGDLVAVFTDDSPYCPQPTAFGEIAESMRDKHATIEG